MEQVETKAPRQSGKADFRQNRISANLSRGNYRSGLIYAIGLLASISMWLAAVRTPLWLDETISYALISRGFSQILPRQGWPTFPAYSYILWMFTKVLGTSEIALRVPSILAMLGATYLLYRSAEEIFDRETAIITAILFSIHPIVTFASIDARPYAFGALATTSAIFVLVRLRRSDSKLLAVLFGVLAACILYFHYLFAVILPGLLICFIGFKIADRKRLWPQLGVALGSFTIAFIPVIPGILYLFRTAGTHVFSPSPSPEMLAWTLVPGRPYWTILAVLLAILVSSRLAGLNKVEGRKILFCGALGVLPALILYLISVLTPIHIFVARYLLVAVPGVALFWGLIVSGIKSPLARIGFCVILVAAPLYQSVSSVGNARHGYSWRYALETAEKHASPDNAPVLMCSDLPESDHATMPPDPKDSNLFGPLSYYKLSVPVVPLPRALNEAIAQQAWNSVEKQDHFLAMGYSPSYKTLEWLIRRASATYDVWNLGTYDGVVVLDFRRSRVGTPRHLDSVQSAWAQIE